MAKYRLLIVNPNSTQAMTESLKPQIQALAYDNTDYTYFTAPAGPKSINNGADADASAEVCLCPLLQLVLAGAPSDITTSLQYDGVLIACYSVHPLVSGLRAALAIPVVGIFEASISASLQLLDTTSNDRFGIVSTGKVWEVLLEEGVRSLLATKGSPESLARFAGVETTGLNATELHDLPAADVESKMREASGRLIAKSGGRVKVVCLGCAGMIGMEQCVREACTTKEQEGHKKVYIIDGVKAGVGMLQILLRGGF
ncbi:MAG: hypothetical protein M1814_002611 [Vezdaea aestivalis]|nr:MAG: hypothetical protein M1814_002611 [Vezdaea aestivalis]